MAYALAFMAMILYATLTPMAKKLGLEGVPPFLFIAIANVFLFILGCIGYYFFERTGQVFVLKQDHVVFLFVFAAINFVAYALFLYALRDVSVASYQLIELLTPVIGAIVAFYLLNESVQPKQIIGFLIMGVGLFIALRPA